MVWFTGPVGFLYVLPNIGGYLFFGTFGSATRQAELEKRRSQQLLAELQTAQSQLQELAVAEERNRLAREMHDSVGHRLTVAVVQLEGAQRLIPSDPDRAARMIGNMRDQMKEALAELRKTVAALRTPLDEALPLDAALTRLAQTFHDGTGLPVQLNLPPNLPPLTEIQRLTLFRAAQEALTNTQRHAKAKQAWLSLSATPRAITLVVADDGQGFPTHSDPSLSNGSFGLQGLTERAAQLGGRVAFQTRSGGGAQLQFTLPLNDGLVT
jgi:signal transduction histidine kinase